METCGLFLSSTKQHSNHTLSGIPAAEKIHVMFLEDQFPLTITSSLSVFLLDKPLWCVSCLTAIQMSIDITH